MSLRHVVTMSSFASTAAISSEDDELQKDELEALEAIYCDDCQILSPEVPRHLQITVPGGKIFANLHLPSTYPSTDAPVIELQSIDRSKTVDSFLSTAKDMLHFVPGGYGCIYEWIQWLSENTPNVAGKDNATSDEKDHCDYRNHDACHGHDHEA